MIFAKIRELTYIHNCAICLPRSYIMKNILKESPNLYTYQIACVLHIKFYTNTADFSLFNLTSIFFLFWKFRKMINCLKLCYINKLLIIEINFLNVIKTLSCFQELN